MHREWARAPLSALLLTAIATLTVPGCTLLLVRDLGIEGAIERGSVSGRLVRADADGEPAPFAQVGLPGSRRSVRTNSEGRFILRGLVPGNWALRLVDDVDGDGWAERAGLRAFRVALEPHANSPADLIVGSAEVETTGLILGDVELEATGVIDGQVTLQGGDFPTSVIGRVAVIRENVGDGDSLTAALGAESVTHVDDDGRFYFAGLRGGPAKVVALAYERVEETDPETQIVTVTLGELLGMSDPMAVTITSDTALDNPLTIGSVDIDSDLASPLDDRRTVVIALSGQVGANAYFMFAPPGQAFPPCEDSPVDYAGTQFDYIEQSDLLGVGNAFPNVDVPAGLVDVQACSNGFAGVLRQQLAEDGIPAWGPIAVGVEDGLCETLVQVPDTSCTEDSECRESADDLERCLPTGEREGLLGTQAFACFRLVQGDCDGDLLPGLPQLTPETAYAWDACGLPGIVDGVRISNRCGGLRGAQLGGATCTVRMGEWAGDYDCDDDGDGQADVDEPLCYGEELGTDLDGDGLCSGLDPFPLCFDNNPVDCDADRNDAAAPGGEPPDLDAGVQDMDAGEVAFDAGSDLDGGTGTVDTGPVHFELDDGWNGGGVLDLPSIGLTAQVGPARIVTTPDTDRAYVVAASDDAGTVAALWSVSVGAATQSGSVWGGEITPTSGFGADLFVDDGATPPKAVLAMTTTQDPFNLDFATPLFGSIQITTLEPGGEINSGTLEAGLFDEIRSPQYDAAPDGGSPPRFSDYDATEGTGVSQSANGELWLTGGAVVNTAGAVYAYTPGFVSPQNRIEVPFGGVGTLPITRWPVAVRTDGDTDLRPDVVFVPAATAAAPYYALASFDLEGGAMFAPIHQPAADLGGIDERLDGYTDGDVRYYADGTIELVMVGRENNVSPFLDVLAVEPGGVLRFERRITLPTTDEEATFEPRAAVIDEEHTAIVLMGGVTPGTPAFQLTTSDLIIIDQTGDVVQTLKEGDLGAPTAGAFVDVHASPAGDGSFLVARYNVSTGLRSLVKLNVAPGPPPAGDLTDGGAGQPGMDAGLPGFDGGAIGFDGGN